MLSDDLLSWSMDDIKPCTRWLISGGITDPSVTNRHTIIGVVRRGVEEHELIGETEKIHVHFDVHQIVLNEVRCLHVAQYACDADA